MVQYLQQPLFYVGCVCSGRPVSLPQEGGQGGGQGGHQGGVQAQGGVQGQRGVGQGVGAVVFRRSGVLLPGEQDVSREDEWCYWC